MLRINLVIVKLGLGLVLGFFIQNVLRVEFVNSLYGTLLCFLFLLVLHLWSNYKRWLPSGFGFLLFIQGVALGLLISSFHTPRTPPERFEQWDSGREQLYTLVIKEVLRPNSWNNRYVAHLIATEDQPLDGKILLTISKKEGVTSVVAGDYISVYARLQPLPKVRQPFQFDYGAYLKSKYIYAQINADCSAVFPHSKKSENLFYVLARFRESVKTQLYSYRFTDHQRQTLTALLLGDRTEIQEELREAYADAGMIHILAVSGLHIGIILWMLRQLTRFLSAYRYRNIRSLLIIVGIWIFALFTGGSPSVLRAATMFSFLEIGRSLGGQNQTGNALLYSAFLLLLFDPSLLYQVGFQLSYLAVIGILWIQPWIYALFHPPLLVLRFIWNTLSVTLSAQIAVLPLSLYYFHQFPGLFLLSNLIVLPFLGLLLGIGILILCLGYFDMLPDTFVSLYGTLIDKMNAFIAWVASQEPFLWKNIRFSLALMLASYFVIYTMILCLKKYSYQRLIGCLGLLLMLCSLLVWTKLQPSPSHLVIVNKAKQSRLLLYTRDHLQIHHNQWVKDPVTLPLIQNYLSAVPVGKITQDSLQTVYKIHSKTLLIVDSVGVYNISDLRPEIILLTQSPKINLDRLLCDFPNTTIVADGSNYKSYVERWRNTCSSIGVPFHSTYEKGAFIIR